MPAPALTVVTVSLPERRALLEEQAAALRRQTLGPTDLEWVVCLNGGAAPGAAAPRGPERTVTLTSDARLAAGAARNLCVARASASVLLFLDDDCLPCPEVARAHLAAHRAGAAAAVGGIDFDDGGAVSRWRPRRARYWHLNGANGSVDAALFRTVGGFDETLAGYGGEDLELGFRLHAAGARFAAVPEAVVVHRGPDPRGGRDLAKARSAGANAARMALRHPPLRWRVGLHPLQVALKRALLDAGLGGVLERLGGGSAGYERAYLEGAAAARPGGTEEAV